MAVEAVYLKVIVILFAQNLTNIEHGKRMVGQDSRASKVTLITAR